MSKMIDFNEGVLPLGFKKHLTRCFDLVSTDIYASPNYIERSFGLFLSEGDYMLVTAKAKEHVNYRELGSFELLDGIFSKGDYLDSFFIAQNVFINKDNKKVKLISLLYEERANIHIWTPYFEELFLPLIRDDLENGVDSHWKSLQEVQQECYLELDVYEIAQNNQVDYEIEGTNGLNSPYVSSVVYYALMKHIFLIEDEKYPTIPGSIRTLQAYQDLYDDHLHNRVDMEKWRKKHHLKDPWA